MGINENNLITCVKKEGKLSRLQLSDISLQRRSHHNKLFWQGSRQRHRQGSQRHCFNPFEGFFLQHWSYSIGLGSSVAKVGEFPNYARPRNNTLSADRN